MQESLPIWPNTKYLRHQRCKLARHIQDLFCKNKILKLQLTKVLATEARKKARYLQRYVILQTWALSDNGLMNCDW